VVTSSVNVLLVENSAAQARAVRSLLSKCTRSRFAVEWVSRLESALECFQRSDFNAILLNLDLPDSHGLETLHTTVTRAPGVPVIVLTPLDNDQSALDAIRQGAEDYLSRDELTATVLERSIRYSIERKRMQRELSRLSTFPRENPNPVVELDREGRVTYMNAAAERELPDLPDSRLNHPFFAGLAPILQDIAHGGIDSRTREITVGEKVYTQDICCDPGGHPLRGCWHVRIYGNDITQLRRAEQEVRRFSHELEQRVRERTREVESANRDLEAFSYSISHDLRAPLRAIDGFSLALLEDYGERLDAPGQHYLNRVRTGVQRMAQLIDAILHLSRLARSELRSQTVDLSSLARTIGDELSSREPQRDVQLVIQEGLTAQGDAGLLMVALQNLLDNAWKFTSTRPTANIELGAAEQHGQTVYFVRDNGVGFVSECAERLFFPFQRLHRDEEFKGLGIGLATVQRVIRRHGGRIWAEAQPERGATFSFTLNTEGARP